MTAFFIILFSVFVALGIFLVIFAMLDDCENSCCALLGAAVAIMGIACIIGILTPARPKAIDVYRNKTTLEITYRDSIPVDTVVVFKK